jgi:hypothetical protein
MLVASASLKGARQLYQTPDRAGIETGDLVKSTSPADCCVGKPLEEHGEEGGDKADARDQAPYESSHR